jgi:hypothetical protein
MKKHKNGKAAGINSYPMEFFKVSLRKESMCKIITKVRDKLVLE